MGKNKPDKSDDSRESAASIEESPALRALRQSDREHERKQLLAHMASRIVVGVMEDPSPATNSPEAFAEVAVDVAEAILQKVGL